MSLRGFCVHMDSTPGSPNFPTAIIRWNKRCSGGIAMPLKVLRKEIEAEREIGHKYLQVLSRA